MTVSFYQATKQVLHRKWYPNNFRACSTLLPLLIIDGNKACRCYRAFTINPQKSHLISWEMLVFDKTVLVSFLLTDSEIDLVWLWPFPLNPKIKILLYILFLYERTHQLHFWATHTSTVRNERHWEKGINKREKELAVT